MSKRIKKRLTAKLRVLKKYPLANYCQTCNVIHEQNGHGDLSSPPNERAMWAEAAKRIKS